MAFHKLLNDNLNEFITLCKKYHIKRVYAFGSVTQPERFSENSDLDFMIAMEDNLDVKVYGDSYLNFWDALEKLFKRKVDLVTEGNLRNRFFINELERTKKIVYEG
jgi:predicted nucleotidyltransferase